MTLNLINIFINRFKIVFGCVIWKNYNITMYSYNDSLILFSVGSIVYRKQLLKIYFANIFHST